MMRKEGGFTLIELVVVVGIISMMSLLMLNNIPKISQSTYLNTAADEVVTLTKDIRQRSISIKEFHGGLFPSYGLYFDTTNPRQVTVYADCVADDSADNQLDNGDSFVYQPVTPTCGAPSDLVETHTLYRESKIDSIHTITSAGTVNETKAYVEFVRPEPSTWISKSDNSLLESGRVEVTLTDRNGEFKKTIVYWNNGHIEII